VGFIFNFWIKRRNPAWWAKYNYVVSYKYQRFSGETKDIDERWFGLWSRDLVDHHILDFEFTQWWD
jgi:hypothetical protein